MDGAVAVRKKAKGIVGIEGAFNAIKEAIDKADTKRAEKKYDKIRAQLLKEGTNYTEQQYNKYAELAEKSKNLTENERTHMLEAVMKGKDKEDGKNRRLAILGIGAGLAETGIELATGQSVIGALLGTFGITAPPATTIVAATLAAGTAFYSLYKLHKSKKFTEAEKILSNEDFLKDFSEMAEEVKKLCNELDKTKVQDVQDLKSNNGKKLTAKEFKKRFAMNAYKIIHNMNLKHIEKQDIAKAYGIEEEVAEFQKEEAQRQADEAARQAEEAAKVEMKAFEEAQKLEAEEMAKQNQNNVERGQE